MYIRSPKDLALFVVDQRKKSCLSQTEIGNRVGLKQKTISAFENNPTSTKLETVFLILSAINLEVNVAAKTDKTTWTQEW